MKERHLFQKSMAWIERLNNYPGCDRKELTVRVQLWVGTAYALLHVLLLTIAFLIFAPEALKVLIGYGYFLAIVLTINLIPLRIDHKLVTAIKLAVLMAGTFYFILRWHRHFRRINCGVPGHAAEFSSVAGFQNFTSPFSPLYFYSDHIGILQFFLFNTGLSNAEG